jgi:hypothetical protein
MTLSDGNEVPSPVRGVFEPSKHAFVMRASCLGPQATPIYRPGESLLFRMAITDRSKLVDRLGGYHYVVIGISERSGLKIFPPEAIATALKPSVTVTPSPELPSSDSVHGINIALPIEGPAEKSRLILLVQRSRAFDVNALRQEISSAIAGKAESERINVVVTKLSGRAPGYLDYSFRTAEGDVVCEPGQ